MTLLQFVFFTVMIVGPVLSIWQGAVVVKEATTVIDVLLGIGILLCGLFLASITADIFGLTHFWVDK